MAWPRKFHFAYFIAHKNQSEIRTFIAILRAYALEYWPSIIRGMHDSEKKRIVEIFVYNAAS